MAFTQNRKPVHMAEAEVWWKAPTDAEARKDPAIMEQWRVHNILFPHVQALEEDQIDIHLQNVLNMKLYSNREPMTFSWHGLSTVSFKPLKPNLENLIQSITDSLRARFATNRPRAKVVTRGAQFGTYRKGRLLDKYIWGEFLHHQVWSKMDRMRLDAMIYGTGFIKVGIDKDELFLERVHPDEIIVDQRECISTEMPLTFVQRKLVSRYWLYETYGIGEHGDEACKAIKEAQGQDWKYTSYRTPADDQVVLIEAWKRPTVKGGSDGRHVICIENYTFVDEPYKKQNFPFVWMKWREGDGFYGLPLISDLMGYQIKQDDMNDLIYHGQHVTCIPRIFVEEGSEFQIASLDNDPARIYTYRAGGNPPQAMTWSAFNPEIYNERERNASNAYKFSGMSEALAQATPLTKQQRFDSAPAQQMFQEAQDTRFNYFVQRDEEKHLELAELIVEISAELYKNHKKGKTFYLSQNVVEQIEWSDVDMERDRFVLQIAAASVLSMSPAARRDQLEEWLNTGKINIEQYYSMSGEPDLERLTQRLAVKCELAEATVDQMLKGTPKTPTAFDWESSLPYVQDELLHLLSLEDVPGEIIDLFIDWLEMAKELKAPAVTEPAMAPGVEQAQAAMGGMPAPGMGPMGPAGMAPDPAQLGMTGVAVNPAVAVQHGGVPVGY